MKYLYKITGAIEIGALLALAVLSPFLQVTTAQASGNVLLRQEVNILDAKLNATSGNYATSSELVSITDNNYSTPAYYFEAVASTSAATNASIYLVNATSSAKVATLTANSNGAYTRYRSSQFVPNASTSVQYAVVIGNESVVKDVIAARIVVLQNPTTLSNTETQIEIGNNETFSGTGTSTLASPKYWYYNSAGWDGSPTFTASVTYQVLTAAIASTTSYTTLPGGASWTVLLPGGTASTSVGLWGGGGGGGAATTNPGGGSGGAGAQFASSTLVATTTSHTLIIGDGGAGGVTGVINGVQGASTTWDGSLVLAGGGMGGLGDSTASSTGISTGCIGTICFRGGNGGAGKTTTTQYGGGGGGGAGTSGAGGDATGAGAAGTGTVVGGGAGAVKNTTAGSIGAAGSAAGGGGAGGNASTNTDRGGGKGGIGRADITDYIATSTIAVQEDNGQFASWVDKAYIVTAASVGGGSPTLTTSASFTPTNGKHYRLVLGGKDSRSSIAIYNAKVVVDTVQSSATEDSYDSATASNSLNVEGTCTGGDPKAIGQSFNAGTGGTLGYVKFYLKKSSTPTGNAVAKIYASTGTHGTDAKPTGAALATSDTLDVSTLSASYALTTLTFSGANQISLSSGTKYIAVIEYTGGDSTKYINPNMEFNTPTHGGNSSSSDCSNVWTANSARDTNFYVLDVLVGGNPTLLEPQYLLANTKYPAGTGLQNFLTRFDPAEWNTTNNYLHAVSAADNSTSVAGLYNAGTLLTNSTVTSPDNYATSTLGVCMPSVAADLNTKATTNNNDLYSDSIVVQVGVASTATGCSPVTQSTIPVVSVHAQLFIREQTLVK